MMNRNILSIFKLDNICFYQNACLNFLNPRQVCQSCQILCPMQAISMRDNLPVIDFSKCSECGFCVAGCPTLALDNSRYPYTDIHNQLIKYPLATISCEKDQVHTKGVTVPCLLSVDLPLLLSISKNSLKLNLYVGACSDCLTAPLQLIRSHFASLQGDLLAINSELEISLTDEPFTESLAEPVSGLTRRELLQSFSLKKFKEFEFVNEEESSLHEESNQRLQERVLYKRKIVSEHLKPTKAKKYTGLLVDRYLIELAPSCNGCNVCAAVCPTNALYWQENDHLSVLYFDSELCIGCEKCTICGLEAIEVHTLNYKDERNINPLLLTSFKLNRCQTCKELFRSQYEAAFCPICDKRRNKENYFKRE